MKFASLFNMESLNDEKQIVSLAPPLANVDPKDIPLEITKDLTPNLEEDKLQDPFPDEYIPTTLAGLQANMEAFNYTTDLAEDNLNLLQASLDIVREDSDVSPLSMTSIVSQLEVAAKTSIVDDIKMVDGLTKTLTTDNPYKYTATLEALTKTLASMRPVIVRGIRPLINVGVYITKNIDIQEITTELNTSHQRMEPSVKQGTTDELDNNVKFYPSIVKAIVDGYSPDQIPSIIGKQSEGDIKIPITACAAIRNGVEAITLSKQRALTNDDIVSILNFYKTVSEIQKATIQLLDAIEAPINVEQFDNATLVNATAHIRRSTGMFWNAVIKDDKAFSKTGDVRQFTIMQDWPAVTLADSGKSMINDLSIDGKHPYIDVKTVSDMITFTISDVLPKFKVIAKNAEVISQKSKQIEAIALKVMSEQVVLTDEAGINFQNTLFRVMDATKFASNIEMSAIQSFDALSKTYTSIAKGIGILGETL